MFTYVLKRSGSKDHDHRHRGDTTKTCAQEKRKKKKTTAATHVDKCLCGLRALRQQGRALKRESKVAEASSALLGPQDLGVTSAPDSELGERPHGTLPFYAFTTQHGSEGLEAQESRWLIWPGCSHAFPVMIPS